MLHTIHVHSPNILYIMILLAYNVAIVDCLFYIPIYMFLYVIHLSCYIIYRILFHFITKRIYIQCIYLYIYYIHIWENQMVFTLKVVSIKWQAQNINICGSRYIFKRYTIDISKSYIVCDTHYIKYHVLETQ